MFDLQAALARIVELETLVTHLERSFDTLNSALVDQQKQLDALRRSLERVESKVSETGDAEPPRDLLDDRPPHY